MERVTVNPNPRRAELKALSNEIKPLAIESQTTINAALLHTYAEQTGKTPQDFKPFAFWKSQGFLIKKGERGFAIWSRPQNITIDQPLTPLMPLASSRSGVTVLQDNPLVIVTKKGKKSTQEATTPPQIETVKTEITFFPMLYLFHDGQVEKIEKKPYIFTEKIGNTEQAQA